MPWLIAALALLGFSPSIAGALADPAGGLLPLPNIGGGIGGLFGGDGTSRRRRRRRALTASDRADIAFITATLGQSAGKAVAIQLVTR